jgi:hypothetical protein
MDPAEALANTTKETADSTPAPAAAEWLNNPTEKQQVSLLDQLENEPTWADSAEEAKL